jgi:deoxycytidylate deaminase
MPRLDDYRDIANQYSSYMKNHLNTSLHIAFVYGRGGALIAMSTNRVGSRSRGAGFSKFTIHAERAALKAVGDNSMLRGATLVVVRIGSKGLLNSKPCHECKCHLEKAIHKYGLKKVYYS